MKITFDNKAQVHLLSEKITADNLRQELGRKYPGMEKVIVFFRADNGPSITFNDNELQKTLCYGPAVVDFTTATAREIAIVSIYDSVVLLEQVKTGLKESSELLLEGDFEQSMMKFSGIISEIKNVVNLVRAISGAGLINLTDGKNYLDLFNENTGGINDLLARIEQSIGVEDSSGVYDMIEYELFPMMDNWQNTMPSLYKDVLDSSSLH